MQTNSPRIALTFDDGPHSQHTSEILDIALHFGIKFTFFVIGNRISKSEKILERAFIEGHEIGNHSWSHKNFKNLSELEIAIEISKTHAVLESLTGKPATLLRPPYGEILENHKQVIANLGYSTVLWNIDTLDWKTRNSEQIHQRIVQNTKDTSIVLMHDIFSETVKATNKTVKQLATSLVFLTVSELRKTINENESAIKIPSFREFLKKLHRDLFRIEEYTISPKDEETELTVFEKLVLTLEDKRFFNHPGIDIIASARECFKAATFQKFGGASTIDMQFIRTVTGYREIRLSRKLYEITLSVLIHFRYSKKCILRSYLECAFFGSGLIGSKQAARKIFHKDISHLSETEAAQLASMLVYPKPLVPKDNWQTRIFRRANYGLRRIKSLEKSLKKIPR